MGSVFVFVLLCICSVLLRRYCCPGTVGPEPFTTTTVCNGPMPTGHVMGSPGAKGFAPGTLPSGAQVYDPTGGMGMRGAGQPLPGAYSSPALYPSPGQGGQYRDGSPPGMPPPGNLGAGNGPYQGQYGMQAVRLAPLQGYGGGAAVGNNGGSYLGSRPMQQPQPLMQQQQQQLGMQHFGPVPGAGSPGGGGPMSARPANRQLQYDQTWQPLPVAPGMGMPAQRQ